jgi:hypothetical protein
MDYVHLNKEYTYTSFWGQGEAVCMLQALCVA